MLFLSITMMATGVREYNCGQIQSLSARHVILGYRRSKVDVDLYRNQNETTNCIFFIGLCGCCVSSRVRQPLLRCLIQTLNIMCTISIPSYSHLSFVILLIVVFLGMAWKMQIYPVKYSVTPWFEPMAFVYYYSRTF